MGLSVLKLGKSWAHWDELVTLPVGRNWKLVCNWGSETNTLSSELENPNGGRTVGTLNQPLENK